MCDFVAEICRDSELGGVQAAWTLQDAGREARRREMVDFKSVTEYLSRLTFHVSRWCLEAWFDSLDS